MKIGNDEVKLNLTYVVWFDYSDSGKILEVLDKKPPIKAFATILYSGNLVRFWLNPVDIDFYNSVAKINSKTKINCDMEIVSTGLVSENFLIVEKYLKSPSVVRSGDVFSLSYDLSY